MQTIIEVEMHAYASGQIRKVTVPHDDVTLGDAFYYGQNDFCLPDDLGQKLPSVSVGDVIRFEGSRYAVCGTRFQLVSDGWIPPRDAHGRVLLETLR